MKHSELWNALFSITSGGGEAALLVVAESRDSSPGKAGFKMVAGSNGFLLGTVGGGIMEYNLIQQARGLLQSRSPYLVTRLHHTPSAHPGASGLSCGGTQTILTFRVTPAHSALAGEVLSRNASFSPAVLTLGSAGISLAEHGALAGEREFRYNADDDFAYRERTGCPETVYVIGGGHVGLAVTRALSLLGFYLVTIDPRDGVFTMQLNSYADKKLYIPYDEIQPHVRAGERSYAVIVTADKESDTKALRAVIGKNLRYIGLMGSKSKTAAICRELEAEGVNRGLLEKVHTPVGMEINAETPAEIAASIAAQIVKVKNEER